MSDLKRGMPADSDKTFYQILNVRETATKTEIRESYIRLKCTYGTHSQALYSLISDGEAQKAMAEIEEAFRILNDEIKRQDYNRSFGGAASEKVQMSIGFDLTREDRGVDAEVDVFSGLSQAGGNVETPETVSDRLPKPVTAVAVSDRAKSKGIRERMEEMIIDSDYGDGDLYRKLRELAGVSQDEMQDRTKVSLEYIRAIESNTFNRLPQTVFVKGFLKSYLKYLAVPDLDRLANAFAGRLDKWIQDKEAK